MRTTRIGAEGGDSKCQKLCDGRTNGLKIGLNHYMYPTLKTSDAGSQYRYRRIGRGVQPPPHTTQKHKNTNTNLCTLTNLDTNITAIRVFALVDSIITDGPIDGRMDGRMDG